MVLWLCGKQGKPNSQVRIYIGNNTLDTAAIQTYNKFWKKKKESEKKYKQKKWE